MNKPSQEAHQKPRYRNQQGKNFKRQQSYEDSHVQSIDGQSAQQSSQLRNPNQRRGQSNKNAGVQSQQNASNLKENRGSVASAKGRSVRGKVNRISNSKVNIEDINIDIDGMMRHQLLMDSSLGLAAAVQSFGTKKSVTTKN